MHEVKVVRIEHVEPHTNADKLELVKIWDYVCVVGKDQFKIGDLAVYVEPDYNVNTNRPEFSFLAKKITKEDGTEETIHSQQRITVRRFRGIWSQGLLIPAPAGVQEGDNVMELLGITRWEPKETRLVSGGKSNLGTNFIVKGPEFFTPKYDLENLKKWSKLLVPGEEVICTVKLHGCNSRYVYHNVEMFCGSRTVWKKAPGYYFTNPKSVFVRFFLSLLKVLFFFDPKKVFDTLTAFPLKLVRKQTQKFVYKVGNNAWWEGLKQNPWIEKWCKENPGVVLYGELIGPQIQGDKFHYGLKDNEIMFRVFDILQNGQWIPNQKFDMGRYDELKFVPIVYRGPYDLKIIENFAEQKESFNDANHIREGIVVKIINERMDPKIGRVALKYVSNNYLSQK